MTRIPFPLVSRWVHYLSVGVVAGVLFYFSVVTAAPTPGGPKPGPFWDKKLHFAGYAALALALAYATTQLRDRPRTRAALVLSLAICYGVGIEFTQGFLPQRYFALTDLLANVVGAMLASAWFLVERRLKYVPLRATTG